MSDMNRFAELAEQAHSFKSLREVVRDLCLELAKGESHAEPTTATAAEVRGTSRMPDGAENVYTGAGTVFNVPGDGDRAAAEKIELHLPWRVDIDSNPNGEFRTAAVVDSRGDIVTCDICEAEAEHLVSCVNSRPTLEAEVTRLREELADFKEIKLQSFSAEPGKFDATMSGDMVMIFTDALAKTFEERGGTNYVEIGVVHHELGPLTLSMQRRFGKTPAQLHKESEEENARLRSQVAAMQRMQLTPEQIETEKAAARRELDNLQEMVSRAAAEAGISFEKRPKTGNEQ